MDGSNTSKFDSYLKSKYAKSYIPTIQCYVRKYQHLLNGNSNLSELESLKETSKNTVIKSLIILSKFLGKHEEFSERLNEYGIKTNGTSSYDAFLRILNNHNNTNNNVLEWLKIAKPILRENEYLFLEYCLKSGLRKNEAIESFNLIIDLASQNKLSDYYDKSLGCLCHFRYPKLFIRHTKNVYITFITETMLNRIASSKPVVYSQIRDILRAKGVNVRINECRDYFGTYLLDKGILQIEIDSMQGRLPLSIFAKHYWSPKLSELRDRVFKALETLTV